MASSSRAIHYKHEVIVENGSGNLMRLGLDVPPWCHPLHFRTYQQRLDRFREVVGTCKRASAEFGLLARHSTKYTSDPGGVAQDLAELDRD